MNKQAAPTQEQLSQKIIRQWVAIETARLCSPLLGIEHEKAWGLVPKPSLLRRAQRWITARRIQLAKFIAGKEWPEE